MGFTEDIKCFADRVISLKDTVLTEEAAKMSMVIPFFQMLGYDVFNPKEFCPEYTADVGIKKGEKVDYAILINDEPAILVECKLCGDILDKHCSQLFRYFGTSTAKFGILTNGIIYKFYTDLDETNKMDLTPFLEFNFLDIRENMVPELKKFCRDVFDKDSIFSTAAELKCSNLIKEELRKETEEPTEEFIRFFLNNIYNGQKNQKVIDKFRPIVKRALTGFINDIVNQKISSTLAKDAPQQKEIEETVNENEKKFIATDAELESFYIIRGMLAGEINIRKIVHRDTGSYFSILFDDNNRKPICRLNLSSKKSQLFIPDEQKNFTKYTLEELLDLYSYKNQLIKVAKRYE